MTKFVSIEIVFVGAGKDHISYYSVMTIFAMTIFVRTIPRAATCAEVDQRGRMSLAPFYRGPPAGVWKATRKTFTVPEGAPLRLGHQTCYRPLKAQRNGFNEQAGQTRAR
jgi:hypothetical protein